MAFLFHKYSKVVVKNFITTPVVVKNFITTSPLRHRQRGNMTRPPVPKPPATTPYSPDPPARRHDRQNRGGLGRRSLRHPKDSEVQRAHEGFWFAPPLRNRCREYTRWRLDGTQVTYSDLMAHKELHSDRRGEPHVTVVENLARGVS